MMTDDQAADDLLSLQARLADIQRWALDAAIKGRLTGGRADQMGAHLNDCGALVAKLREA